MPEEYETTCPSCENTFDVGVEATEARCPYCLTVLDFDEALLRPSPPAPDPAVPDPVVTPKGVVAAADHKGRTFPVECPHCAAGFLVAVKAEKGDCPACGRLCRFEDVTAPTRRRAEGAEKEGKGERSSPPVTAAEYRATGVLLGAFVVTMVVAVLLAPPLDTAGYQAFPEGEEDNPLNLVFFFAMILGFTALILWLATRYKKVIQIIILGAVAASFMYVIGGLMTALGGVRQEVAVPTGLALGAGVAWWLYKRPEWYVIDLAGLVVAAAAAAIFGISLEIRLVLIMLVLLAIYDAIAVYKTKHMLSLADTVIDLRLPVLLVVPKHRGYSFRAEAGKFKEATQADKSEREAMFMGLGDLVMPTILVVAALQFANEGWGYVPSLGAAIGTLVGFGVLMSFVLRGNPQAGLPLLNGGAILGFFVALWAKTGSLVFW